MCGCLIHFATCTLSPCNLYVGILESPMNLFLHSTTSVTFLQRFPATDILTVTLGRWTPILGTCEVYTGNKGWASLAGDEGSR